MATDRTVPVSWLVALGALYSLALGAVVLFAFRRKTSQIAGPQLSGPPINIWNINGSQPPNMLGAVGAGTFGAGNPAVDPNAVPVTPTPPAYSAPSKLATYTLNPGRPIRIMTAASANYWRVQLSTIGPPGAVARVFNDIGSIAFPSAATAILAGRDRELRVQPGAALFAVSDTPNTELSVVAAEDV